MQALAHGLRLPQALKAPQCVRRSRGRSRGLACRAELTSDGAARIKGAVEDVFSYVADPGNFIQYRPGVQDCRLIKGNGPEVSRGSCWQLAQTVGPLKDVSITYEILDLQPERRVVYAISSDLFTGTEQTVFIEDPNEPVVVVRTVSTVELKLLKRFLQPFVAGSLTNAQLDNMGRLADLLNGANSPIKDSWEKVERRQSKNPFSSLFGGRRRSSSSGSTKRRSGSPAPVRGADLLGYYQALGLDSRKYKYTKPEDIKAAFRSAALVMHPDKFSMDADLMSDEERRKDMEDNYKKLARAYEVLRNPEQKRLYDEGRLGELQQQQQKLP